MRTTAVWTSVGLALIGLVVIAIGFIGAWQEWNMDETTPFLIAGFAFIALGVFHTRLTTLNLEAGGAKLGVAFQEFADLVGTSVAREIERLGLADLAACYQILHEDLRKLAAGDDENTVPTGVMFLLQDGVIDLARQRSRGRKPKTKVLDDALRSQSVAGRCIALGVALAHPGAPSADVLTEANILKPNSPNEQYHALLVARERVPLMSDLELDMFGQAIERCGYSGTRQMTRGQRIARSSPQRCVLQLGNGGNASER